MSSIIAEIGGNDGAFQQAMGRVDARLNQTIEGGRRFESKFQGIFRSAFSAPNLSSALSGVTDNLGDIFKNKFIGAAGLGASVGFMVKGAIEDAAKGANDIFDSLQASQNQSTKELTALGIEGNQARIKGLEEQEEKLKNMGRLQKFLFSDEIKYAQEAATLEKARGEEIIKQLKARQETIRLEKELQAQQKSLSDFLSSRKEKDMSRRPLEEQERFLKEMLSREQVNKPGMGMSGLAGMTPANRDKFIESSKREAELQDRILEVQKKIAQEKQKAADVAAQAQKQAADEATRLAEAAKAEAERQIVAAKRLADQQDKDALSKLNSRLSAMAELPTGVGRATSLAAIGGDNQIGVERFRTGNRGDQERERTALQREQRDLLKRIEAKLQPGEPVEVM
jgi:hypothetical protein